MTEKLTARRLSNEEKDGINQMLIDKRSYKDITQKYHISTGTVSTMVKKLAGKTKQTATKDSKSTNALKGSLSALQESLVAIKNRKAVVEEMLSN